MSAASDVRSLLVIALVAACASERPPPQTPPSKPAIAEDVVERSRLPLSLWWRGEERSLDELLPQLSAAAAVCIGESHDNPHHHYAQWELVKALVRATGTRPVAVGFEMFQTPFQGALSRYSADGDAEKLLAASEFETRWGHSFNYYAPILRAAHDAGAPLLALNAPRELTKAVAKDGVGDLPPELAQKLPELDENDAEHRAFFERAMGMKFGEASKNRGHDHGGMSIDHLYLAQLVWDETMAQTASQWLSTHSGGQIVIIAGSGHCQRAAVPKRIQRRGPYEVVAARAVLASQKGEDEAPPDSAFDLLLVLDDGMAVARTSNGE